MQLVKHDQKQEGDHRLADLDVEHEVEGLYLVDRHELFLVGTCIRDVTGLV